MKYEAAKSETEKIDAYGGKESDPYERTTGGSILTFPNDHKLHNGSITENENFQEWFYWTGFPKDPDDGAQLAVFVCLFRNFENDAFAQRYTLTIFRPDNEVLTETVIIKSLSARIGRTKDRKDTFVRYEGDGFAVTHVIGADTWHVVADNRKSGKDRLAIDLIFTPTSRGYVAESPSGIAYQGAPSYATAAYDQTTLRCLSYYYSAPRMSEVGTLTAAGKTMNVKDETAWFDHQWGGFYKGCNAYNYNWLGARLDNGATFMVRDWHDTKQQSVAQFRRFAFFPKEGPPRYWQGTGAFELTERESYVSKSTGRRYGLKYDMTSSEGAFRFEPMFYAEHLPYAYWEGGMWIRKLNDDGTPGEIIGKAFLEQSQSNR